MKSKLFLLSFIFASVFAFAQNSNLVLFSEQGERFFVVLNGIRQNAAPETNVKVTGLNQPTYKVKIIFDDKTIPDLDKNVFLEMGTEMVLNVKKNKNGEYVLRLLSQAPIADAPPAPAPSQSVITYTTTPPPLVSVTTTTTTTSTAAPVGGNVSVGMNVGGVGVNMSITDNTMVHGTTTTTYTETVETTTVSNHQPAPTPPPSYLPGYNGPIGCPMPINPNDFSGVKSSISSKSFEDSKLQVAKQVCGSNCLLSGQVREIMQLFSFEDTRLEFAKFAYGHTYDLGNYYKVNDAFQFESSIDDLNRYIGAKH
jgi:hypothetical protein